MKTIAFTIRRWDDIVSRVFLYGAVAMLTPAAVLINVALYWTLFDRAEPLTVEYQHPVPVSEDTASRETIQETKEVRPGQTIYTWNEYCLTERGRTGTQSAVFTNHLTYQLPVVSTAGRVGCYKRKFSYIVPHNAAPGPLTLHVRLTYEVNPINTVTVELPPVKMVVIK